MTRYWVSWNSSEADYRPLTYPPPPAILGWWCSGEGDTYHTLCAVVAAKSKAEAKRAIAGSWPETKGGKWRFFDEVEPDWIPGERFVKKKWMLARFEANP